MQKREKNTGPLEEVRRKVVLYSISQNCHTTFLLSATVQAIEKRICQFIEPTLNNVRSDF